MKSTKMLLLLTILLAAAAVGMNIARISYKLELREEQKIADVAQNRRIEELEKEVRLLKTDVYILQYGFEGVHSEKADNSR